MAESFQLRIIDEEKRTVFIGDYSKRVELGRQDRGEAGPYTQRFEVDRWRIVVAPLTEDIISRHHLSLEPLPDGRFRLRNDSKAIPIRLTSGEEVKPGETRELPIPSQMMLGRKMIRVVAPESVSAALNELPEATLPPGSFDGLATRMGGMKMPQFTANDPAGLIRWVRAVMEVLQGDASSPEFFDKAAQAAAELVGLDSVSVWLLKEDEWCVEAQMINPRLAAIPKAPASRHVLNKVRQRARTIWDKPESSSTSTTSLDSIASVVASPILNSVGEVIGCLYGERSFLGQTSRQWGEITEVQAMLVELLAGGIAAGLERIRHEQAALAARVQFEQFFPVNISLFVASNPDVLVGREREITLLYYGIRDFAKIAQVLGPTTTVGWVSDITEALTGSILIHQGVLVDDIGEGQMAMWGAPIEQPDHAILACRAALDMFERLPKMVERWKPILGEEFDLGIGLHTGVSWVGNTGSRRRFRYGPQGEIIEMTHRVEAATRALRVWGLMTGTTAAMIESIPIRRIGRFRIPRHEEPVELYELVEADRPSREESKALFEEALGRFENQESRRAAEALASLVMSDPADEPARSLMGRILQALSDPRPFDPIETLPD